jgi:hypothetical protein
MTGASPRPKRRRQKEAKIGFADKSEGNAAGRAEMARFAERRQGRGRIARPDAVQPATW